MPVHLTGRVSRMDEIIKIAKNTISVIAIANPLAQHLDKFAGSLELSDAFRLTH